MVHRHAHSGTSMLLLSAISRRAPDRPGQCTASPMAVTTPRQKPPLAAFSILDSIHKQSNTILHAMLTLKVFSQNMLEAS